MTFTPVTSIAAIQSDSISADSISAFSSRSARDFRGEEGLQSGAAILRPADRVAAATGSFANNLQAPTFPEERGRKDSENTHSSRVFRKGALALFDVLFAAQHDDPKKQDREHGTHDSNSGRIHRISLLS
jgi:hypothetical protein